MDDLPVLLYGSALGTGLVFGYVIQRGGFCLTRALSNALLMRDATILRAYGLALLVAMAGVEILEVLALVDIPLRPLHWLSNIVGGLLFGVGMILSGGCSGSTWYRAGEGAVGAWVVLLGFAIGATTAGVGVLSPVRTLLQKPTLATGDGGPPTLASLTGLPPWIVIAALALAGAIWLQRDLEHGDGPGRSGGRLRGRVDHKSVRLEAPRPREPREDLLRRPAHGRRRPHRRGLQHQPRPDQLGDPRAGKPARIRLDVRRRLRHAVVSLFAEDLTQVPVGRAAARGAGRGVDETVTAKG